MSKINSSSCGEIFFLLLLRPVALVFPCDNEQIKSGSLGSSALLGSLRGLKSPWGTPCLLLLLLVCPWQRPAASLHSSSVRHWLIPLVFTCSLSGPVLIVLPLVQLALVIRQALTAFTNGHWLCWYSLVPLVQQPVALVFIGFTGFLCFHGFQLKHSGSLYQFKCEDVSLLAFTR